MYICTAELFRMSVRLFASPNEIANFPQYLCNPAWDNAFQWVYGLIQSLTDYCCIVWGKTTKTNLIRIYKLQKRVLRLILDVDIDFPATEMFYRLQILPIDLRINYFIALLTFTILSGVSPSYLSNIFTFVGEVHNYHTRSVITEQLYVPKFNSNQGQRTFKYRAAKLWNSLPNCLNSSTNENNFKNQLKSYMLN